VPVIYKERGEWGTKDIATKRTVWGKKRRREKKKNKWGTSEGLSLTPKRKKKEKYPKEEGDR